MISDSCSKSGIGSVGLEAEESNLLTETTVVSVAVALPSHPTATTWILASPVNPSFHVA